MIGQLWLSTHDCPNFKERLRQKGRVKLEVVPEDFLVNSEEESLDLDWNSASNGVKLCRQLELGGCYRVCFGFQCSNDLVLQRSFTSKGPPLYPPPIMLMIAL